MQRDLPVWVAARSPESHDFAVANGCNVMVTPLMKGDEEVQSLVEKYETAIADHPEIAQRPEIMVLRHTYVHAEDEPEGRRADTEGVQKFYRTFDAWFGNKQEPVDGFMEPSPITSPQRSAPLPKLSSACAAMRCWESPSSASGTTTRSAMPKRSARSSCSSSR
ncbi:LLM class flavin-dependent oxidoreductase [Arthrobacter sp. MYb224]|uniref:LLM class flavin-dependent oxidoreductase n=1 Tax=Arthrobacter sp. MYb224 TaxID=1848600 RepID=UPI0021579F82|nr:LLM class flavin-dependent oxidoreductase [Arthrobacter sp. MYb224]